MRIEGLSAGYGKKIIVKDVDIEIRKGEIISLIGPNGGGKSTILKTISRQLDIKEGAVYIDNRHLEDFSIKELAKQMSIVTTERIKPQLMTLFDVVLSGRLPFTDGLGTFRSKDRDEAKRAIELMRLGDIEGRMFTDLSDGQKQRALIARAICQSPRFLIMDEPTSYLDIRYKMELSEVIKELTQQGITVIMSLHELDMAMELSDRLLLVYEDGHCLCEKPQTVRNRGYIKDLYGLSSDMYESVTEKLPAPSGIDAGRTDAERADDRSEASPKDRQNAPRHSSYFLNKECEYYPCHDLSEDRFSCMFCYCPLYDIKDCGGIYTYTEKGAKNCKDCIFPHDRNNYAAVIKKLKEKMYGNSIRR